MYGNVWRCCRSSSRLKGAVSDGGSLRPLWFWAGFGWWSHLGLGAKAGARCHCTVHAVAGPPIWVVIGLPAGASGSLTGGSD